MNEKTLAFSIFCIEGLTELLDMNAKEVYRMLKVDTDILDGYIIPCYEILHSQSKKYILDDLVEVLKERGIIKC